MKYCKYNQYRHSGFIWLGDIPAHWETRKLKHVASCNDDTLNEDTDPDKWILYIDIGSVSEGKIQKTEELSFQNAPSRARRLVKDGDIILSTVRTYLRAIAEIENPPEGLVASTGFAIIRPRTIDGRFLAQALKSNSFIDWVVAESKGIGYPAINSSDLMGLSVTLPPTKEQSKIATFLDKETTRIDALIEKKARFIELLKEKRQALITQAVTKGVDPSVDMKDSGIAWIGEIPTHWKIKKIRHISRSVGGGTPDRSNSLYWNGKISWVTPKDMKNQFVNSSMESITEKGVTNSSARKICPGAVLIVFRSGILRHTLPVAINTKELAINQDIRAYYFFDELNQEFFMRFIQGLNEALLVYWSKQGSTVESIEADLLDSSWIPVPPTHEQQHILKKLSKETARIDLIIDKTTHSINLLKERRSALITAAVTGQIDLREAAA